MAAGPKTIMTEMLRECRQFQHAMGYAPGMDLLDSMDDWCFLNNHFGELVDKLEKLVSEAPDGSAEEVRKAKYGS